jgi:hypothetical protein
MPHLLFRKFQHAFVILVSAFSVFLVGCMVYMHIAVAVDLNWLRPSIGAVFRLPVESSTVEYYKVLQYWRIPPDTATRLQVHVPWS